MGRGDLARDDERAGAEHRDTDAWPTPKPTWPEGYLASLAAARYKTPAAARSMRFRDPPSGRTQMGRQKREGKKKEREHRRRGKRWGWPLTIALGVAVFALVWWTFATPSIPYGDPEAIARGAALYTAMCTGCHGARAEGEDPLSPMGGMKPNGEILAPALNGFGHAWHHQPPELASVIKRGSPRPGTRMVGWEGRLSDSDVRSLIAYLYSLWPRAIQQRYLTNPHH
jgi:mono/diheme cytochrome c family protein